MKNEKRLVMALVVLVVMFLTFLSASADFENAAPQQTTEDERDLVDEDLIVVGFSQLGRESVWRATHTQSIQNALSKENGFFLQYSNARQKQENQIKAIRGFISQQVDWNHSRSDAVYFPDRTECDHGA